MFHPFLPPKHQIVHKPDNFLIALFSITEHLENTIGCVGCSFYSFMCMIIWFAGVCWTSLNSKTPHVLRQVHFFLEWSQRWAALSLEWATPFSRVQRLPNWCWSCCTPKTLLLHCHTSYFTLAEKHARWKAQDTWGRLCVCNILQPSAVQIYLPHFTPSPCTPAALGRTFLSLLLVLPC